MEKRRIRESDEKGVRAAPAPESVGNNPLAKTKLRNKLDHAVPLTDAVFALIGDRPKNATTKAPDVWLIGGAGPDAAVLPQECLFGATLPSSVRCEHGDRRATCRIARGGRVFPLPEVDPTGLVDADVAAMTLAIAASH